MMNRPLALIVEDEYDISVVFAKAVELAGYETQVIHAGDEAIEWLSTASPSLVVLDLNLPRVMGADILKHIRAEPRLSEAFVIVATAYQHLAESTRSQADHVFTKPVGFRQLIDLAARVRANASTN